LLQLTPCRATASTSRTMDTAPPSHTIINENGHPRRHLSRVGRNLRNGGMHQ
jgi:hypothetical protein